MVIKIVIWLLKLTIRSLRVVEVEPPPAPAVIILWHEELLGLAKVAGKQQDYALVSSSKDGDLISDFLKDLNWKIVRASSHKNNFTTFKLLTNLDSKYRIYITSDGSRGPRRKIKNGALYIAKKRGCPVYTLRLKCKGFRLNTWDKMLVPLPFAKAKCYYSQAIYFEDAKSIDFMGKTAAKYIYELGKKINDPECN